MTLTEKNNILQRLGKILDLLGSGKDWPGYELGINEVEYNALDDLIQRVHVYNGWFKETEVRRAFKGIASWMTHEGLSNWQSSYQLQDKTDKKVAIIMAGNIPLVGFHDFISVFLSGHKAIVKLSSDDQHLFPAIIKTMSLFDEEIYNWVELSDNKMEGFDAVIATGSDNSSRYFESYFGKYPNVIRKNRTSVAVLEGDESKEELFQLGHDIFDFYGLGCRNVSQIWIPEDFNLDVFFEAIYDHNEIIHHNKYANNYDYNKAVLLMNQEELLDNGFLLLKEDRSLHSPLAVIHFIRYSNISEFDEFYESNLEKIQAVIGKKHIPFGNSQKPKLTDYADGVDTLKFLSSL